MVKYVQVLMKIPCAAQNASGRPDISGFPDTGYGKEPEIVGNNFSPYLVYEHHVMEKSPR